jgi:hypothetical protein
MIKKNSSNSFFISSVTVILDKSTPFRSCFLSGPQWDFKIHTYFAILHNLNLDQQLWLKSKESEMFGPNGQSTAVPEVQSTATPSFVVRIEE